MKKNRMIAFATLVAMMGCMGVYAPTKVEDNVAATAATATPVTPTTYTTANGYVYNTEEQVNISPDTFEAWVKLPVTSLGGTIAGNYLHSHAHTIFNAFDWKVDIYGHFGFEWNNLSIDYTFSSSQNLFDDQWHHIALVRDAEGFTYYLDGEQEGYYATASSPAISGGTMNIGSSDRGWLVSPNPLEGFVKSVTFYEGAITPAQVQADMADDSITKADDISDNAELWGSWNLGETWTQRRIENEVEGGCALNLNTQNKYVGADYSFGEYDYTFVIVPDIQIMSHFNPNRLNRLMQWIVDNKETYKIDFVTFVGDLSDSGNLISNYEAAATAMAKLNGRVPYCFVPGNHDYVDNFTSARDTTHFNYYNPYSVHSQLPGFGGTFEPNKMDNSYYTFETRTGEKYLVINMEFRTRRMVLRWAGRVIEQHPEHRVILNRHDNLSYNFNFEQTIRTPGYDVTNAQEMFDMLGAKYSNVFLNIGGHYCADDIERRVDYGENGNKVLSMLVDGQGATYKGEGGQDIILMMHVNESEKKINAVYYSPEKDKVWNIQNQFQYSFADANNPAIGA